MYVLGIETSCDETAASVVKDGERVLSSVVASSLKEHRKYGGVVPEIASRMHLESICAVTQRALKEGGIGLDDIGLVSVTSGPGLAGSLLVGISFAKSLSLGLGIPVLGVDHLTGHIYANLLSAPRLRRPFVALIVSGGHTTLFYVKDFDKIDMLGRTCDDACGEAFDKVAKIMGLGYPGGPLIERLAASGEARRFRFRCSNTQRPLDFSFSGIKTAVLYTIRKEKRPGRKFLCDVAASFQEAAIDALLDKSLAACRIKGVRQLAVGGGVAVNKRLREKFRGGAGMKGIEIFFPAPGFCLDNAAMVAGLGYRLFKKGCRSDLGLNVGLN